MAPETVQAEERTNGKEVGGSHATALLRRAEERPPAPETEEKLQLERIAQLPVKLDVRVPLPNFRVADLLCLSLEQVVASEWPSSDDVPLICGDVQLVWTEFEVVDQTLAVRVTRLV